VFGWFGLVWFWSCGLLVCYSVDLLVGLLVGWLVWFGLCCWLVGLVWFGLVWFLQVVVFVVG
jgi:hypothetical protein